LAKIQHHFPSLFFAQDFSHQKKRYHNISPAPTYIHVLYEGKNIHVDVPDGLVLVMDGTPYVFDSFPVERGLPASVTHPRRDIFHHHHLVIYPENFRQTVLVKG